MLGLLLIAGLPAVAALLFCRTRLDKTWTYFGSSVVVFAITTGLLPVTFPLAAKVLAAYPDYVFLAVFGPGVVLTIVLWGLLAYLEPKRDVHFPEIFSRILNLGLIYVAALLQLLLLTFAGALLLGKLSPATSQQLLQASGRVLPKCAAVCALTPRQQMWLSRAPGEKPVAPVPAAADTAPKKEAAPPPNP